MTNSDYVTIFLASSNASLINKKIDGINISPFELCFDTYNSKLLNIVVKKINQNLYLQERTNVKFLNIKSKTSGALLSLALTLDMIPSDTPILVVPGNSVILNFPESFVSEMIKKENNLGIIGFNSNNEFYSYVRIKEGKIIEVKEKEKIGNIATAGVFYFKDKKEIISCIEWCLINNFNLDGNYFLSLSLNYFVCNNLKIGLTLIDEKSYLRFSRKTEFAYFSERITSEGL